MSWFESPLRSLNYLPFKPIWLRSTLYALCVLLWQSTWAGVHYVDPNSTNATPPYANWATAATNIQDAVDAAGSGDEVVVTNGIYATGSRMVDDGPPYRAVIAKTLEVRSVNGPLFTTIDGGQSVLCVVLTNSASLSGFTVTGAVDFYGGRYGGGGAIGGTLHNCALTGNSGVGARYCTLNNCALADNPGVGASDCTLNDCTLTNNRGGGATQSTLNNCVLAGNHGSEADFSTLNNCTLTGTYDGLGAYNCILNNCIAYFNGVNYDSSSILNYCCTTPLPTSGVANTTNAPLFVDTNGWASLRLQPMSACINAGNNSYATNATDLDGYPRISGGKVDIGAYEFQWPQLTIAPSWQNVLLRWPTNSARYDYTGFTLQSTTNLLSPSVWVTNSPAPVVIADQNTVTNPITGPRQFYRLIH